jgi:hypothetical protein
MQPGIMTLLSGGFTGGAGAGSTTQAAVIAPVPVAAPRVLLPPQYVPLVTSTNWDNSSGGRQLTAWRNEQYSTNKPEQGTNTCGADRDQWRGSGPSLFRPMSPATVGLRIARIVPPSDDYQCSNCTKPHHANGPHRSYECLSAYMAKFGEPCPAMTQTGTSYQERGQRTSAVLKTRPTRNGQLISGSTVWVRVLLSWNMGELTS